MTKFIRSNRREGRNVISDTKTHSKVSLSELKLIACRGFAPISYWMDWQADRRKRDEGNGSVTG